MRKQDGDVRRGPAGIRSLAYGEGRRIGDTGFDGTDRLGADPTQVQQHRQSGDKAGMHGDFTAIVERVLATALCAGRDLGLRVRSTCEPTDRLIAFNICQETTQSTLKPMARLQRFLTWVWSAAGR